MIFLMFETTYAQNLTAGLVPKGLVRKLCLASFHSSMKAEGKVPPTELGNFACRCFVSKINKGATIKTAKLKCRNEAIREFPLY